MGEWDPPSRIDKYPRWTVFLAATVVIAFSVTMILAGAALVIWAL